VCFGRLNLRPRAPVTLTPGLYYDVRHNGYLFYSPVIDFANGEVRRSFTSSIIYFVAARADSVHQYSILLTKAFYARLIQLLVLNNLIA